MTPEAQRIAIAEACGWTRIMASPGFATDETFPRGVEPGKASMSFFRTLPDYLSDLNAMHEAEKVLSDDQYWPHFYDNLSEGCGGYDKHRNMLSATAAQRAEAFLRTLGKWEDS
jgi:hypothetical protein